MKIKVLFNHERDDLVAPILASLPKRSRANAASVLALNGYLVSQGLPVSQALNGFININEQLEMDVVEPSSPVITIKDTRLKFLMSKQLDKHRAEVLRRLAHLGVLSMKASAFFNINADNKPEPDAKVMKTEERPVRSKKKTRIKPLF